ncbi:MAG: NADH-quinone oxidoreductase subunit L, partial [Rudaea sp.]|nr:NADH-quinone oxidoreductase subunit L [Rudaea sp.]
MSLNPTILLIIALAPLVGAIIAGIFRHQVGRVGAHTVTIAGVALSCVLSFYVLYQLVWGGAQTYNENLYTWLQVGGIDAHVGFLVDRLTAMMMVVVTFVSLMVHVYTIGYMAEDDGYQRFFSYIALFTFSMLMLVMSNNFLQLFFGWEAVGLVSYLLIGFWFKKPSASAAAMKAFIVNRVGDMGLALAVAVTLMTFGTTTFGEFLPRSGEAGEGVLTWLGLLLLLAACAKSAQVPLQSWLGDAMEGPTPVSALIHAATMVTAGVYLIVRTGPVFEAAPVAQGFVLAVGAVTLLFGAVIGCAKDDIKKALAASTMSQIGYMVLAAGLGPAGYALAIAHLLAHGSFKAGLFLGAGSVMHGMND